MKNIFAGVLIILATTLSLSSCASRTQTSNTGYISNPNTSTMNDTNYQTMIDEQAFRANEAAQARSATSGAHGGGGRR